MRMPRYHFNTQFLRMSAFQWKRLSGNCRHGKAAGARRTGSDKVLYHEADHLGSVHVVKDGGSNVRQRFDYYPFGKVSQAWTDGTDVDYAHRWRFGGKEIAGQKMGASVPAGIAAAAAGSPYLDFGARLYDPRTAAWLSQDPLSEKYYSISLYAYCSNDPLNRFDLDGYVDFKNVAWGLFNAGTGLATAIGGGFVAVGSYGLAGLVGGAMIAEGSVQLGLGLTQVVLGFADKQVPEGTHVPSTSLGTMGMAVDEIRDIGTHTYEAAGDLVTAIVTMSNPLRAKSTIEAVAGLSSQVQVVLTTQSFIESFSSKEERQVSSAPAIDYQEIDWQEELTKNMIWKP